MGAISVASGATAGVSSGSLAGTGTTFRTSGTTTGAASTSGVALISGAASTSGAAGGVGFLSGAEEGSELGRGRFQLFARQFALRRFDRLGDSFDRYLGLLLRFGLGRR